MPSFDPNEDQWKHRRPGMFPSPLSPRTRRQAPSGLDQTSSGGDFNCNVAGLEDEMKEQSPSGCYHIPELSWEHRKDPCYTSFVNKQKLFTTRHKTEMSHQRNPTLWVIIVNEMNTQKLHIRELYREEHGQVDCRTPSAYLAIKLIKCEHVQESLLLCQIVRRGCPSRMILISHSCGHIWREAFEPRRRQWEATIQPFLQETAF